MKNYILKLLPKVGRITKQELCNKTGLSERLVRKEIENLRKDGVKVHSSSVVSGYKLVDTPQEDKELMIQYFSRLKAEYETLVALYGEDEVNGNVFKIINKTFYTA